MEISQKIAGNIVSELRAVINLNINIMDGRGVIIASTDSGRIGMFHEAALELIKGGVSEIIVRYDGQYHGAKQGLNYPIVMQGEIIGVLGITGVYEEIVEKALIIKRMSELLLQSAYAAEQKRFDENVRNRYLDEWITGDAKNMTAAFVERGKALNIDIAIPRRFLVCSIYPENLQVEMDALHHMEAAERRLCKFLSAENRDNLYLKNGSTLVCAVCKQSDEEVKNLIAGMRSVVRREGALNLAAGVDGGREEFTAAKSAYRKARHAYKVCMRTHKWETRFYTDLNMEVFADEVSETSKIEYVHRIFKGYTDREIRENVVLLENYYDTDGSITATADKLFLHKNTLQYKLRRVAEKTGYDPRSIRHSSLFYIAIYFFRELDGSFFAQNN